MNRNNISFKNFGGLPIVFGGSKILAYSLVLGICNIAAVAGESQQITGVLKWDKLPRLPVLMGVAGPFSGVSNTVLIVAGGTSFSAPLWKDGKKNPAAEKLWHDKVYVLESPDGSWQDAGSLPHPLAYGVSISTKYGLICVGGSDSEKVYKTVFLLEWVDGEVKTTRLPDLPEPRIAAAGELEYRPVIVPEGLQCLGDRTSAFCKIRLDWRVKFNLISL